MYINVCNDSANKQKQKDRRKSCKQEWNTKTLFPDTENIHEWNEQVKILLYLQFGFTFISVSVKI